MQHPDPAPLPPLYRIYASLTAAMTPAIHRHAKRKLAEAGVSAQRCRERSGHASLARPTGPLIWLHAVSVGEFQSVLGLLRVLREERPDVTILVTTTTPTSAKLAETRLPKGCLHQFAPLDTAVATRRFLDHWQPDLAIFVESEIWPRQIVTLHDRDTPLLLINARLSAGSLKTWRKVPALAQALLSRFSAVLCQIDATRDALLSFGYAPERAVTTGDLKKSSDPLPVDADALRDLQSAVGDRSLWVASSTHPGEDEEVLKAHRTLLAHDPDALMVLLPRHPERGDDLAAMLRNEGFDTARRSKGEMPADNTQVYLADTLGETGLFYQLAPVVFVAGSFVPVGGHNPFEPAHFDCAILHGPLVANFAQSYAEMKAAGATVEVENAEALSQELVELMAGNTLAELQKSAKAYVQEAQTVRDTVARTILEHLPV